MSKLSDAAEQVQGLAERFRGIVDLADELKRLGSVEQAIEERKAGLATAAAQHEEALSQVAKTLTVLDGVKTDTAQRIAETEATVKTMLSEAREQSAALVAEGRRAAQALVDAAKNDLAGTLDAHERAMEGANQRLRTANTAAGEVEAKVKALRETHAGLTSEISALRQRAKVLAG